MQSASHHQCFWDSNRDVSASVKQFTPSHLPSNVNHSSCMYVLHSAPTRGSVHRYCEPSSPRFCYENIPVHRKVDRSRPPGCALVKSKRVKRTLPELCVHIGTTLVTALKEICFKVHFHQMLPRAHQTAARCPRWNVTVKP